MAQVNCFSYFNPCAKQHHSTKDFKNLNNGQQAAVIIVTVLAAIASIPLVGIGGIAAFRRVVQNYSQKNAAKVSKIGTDTLPSKKNPKVESSVSIAKASSVTASEVEDEKGIGPIFTTPQPKFEPISQKQYLSKVKGYVKDKLKDEDQKHVIKAFEKCIKGDISSKKVANQYKKNLSDYLDTLVKNRSVKKSPSISSKARKQCLQLGVRAFHSIENRKCEPQFIAKMPLPNTQLKALSDFCQRVESNGKKALYMNAMYLFEEFECEDKIEQFHFTKKELKEFALTRKQTPEHFKEKFEGDDDDAFLMSTKQFYNYFPAPMLNHPEEYYVDFANSRAGGNMDHGFVQEEIMLAEMPNLANLFATYIKKGNRTTLPIRDGGDNREKVMGGTPNPKVFRNAVRVQEINAYNDMPLAIELKDKVEELPAPQLVNVLAMAAPRLESKKLKEQLDIKTAKDLFNTVQAGFKLAAKNSAAGKNIIIHSGRLGCGVFHNNWKLVFLLQMLAAKHQNLYLVLHDCSDQDRQEMDILWQSLLPKMQGESLEKCVTLIVAELKEDYAKDAGS